MRCALRNEENEENVRAVNLVCVQWPWLEINRSYATDYGTHKANSYL